MFRRGWRGRAIVGAAAGILVLVLAGCLTDPDEGPSYRPIDVRFVRFPSHLNPNAEAESIDVAFYVGSNGCWGLEEIDLRVDDRTIVVSGTARNENRRDMNCTDALVYGGRRLALPPLESGTYEFRSCGMVDTITVDDAAGPVTNRLLLKGFIENVQEGCGAFFTGSLLVGLSGLPDSVPDGTVIVWADETSGDQFCDLPGENADAFGDFRRLAAYSP